MILQNFRFFLVFCFVFVCYNFRCAWVSESQCAVPTEARRRSGFLMAGDAVFCELSVVGFCDPNAGPLLKH